MSGGSFNTEIEFTDYLPYSTQKKNITSYLFADAGFITSKKLTKQNYIDALSEIRADAGIGITYTFNNFGALNSGLLLINLFVL